MRLQGSKLNTYVYWDTMETMEVRKDKKDKGTEGEWMGWAADSKSDQTEIHDL